jgi:hypothetical protein
MKTLRIVAMFIGVLGTVFGLNSCKKDEPEKVDTQECCSATSTEGVVSYTTKACEDGTFTYTYSSGGTTETYTGDFSNDYTWAYVKGDIISSNGSCGQE